MNINESRRMRNGKRNPSETVAYALLLSGTITLVTSIVYSSSILAFVGLSLTFWGALLLYLKPTKHVKVSLLDSTTISSLRNIDQIITDLDYKGKAIYLPAKYHKDLKGEKVFIPSKYGIIIPPAKEVAQEKIFFKNPKGICLTPPGLGLANLYEKELGKDFKEVDLNYLQENLPKLFVEDLEIAEDLEIEVEHNMIRVKITGSINKDLCDEARGLLKICSSLGCPLCSSIAIAITRATGSPLIIEKTEVPMDSETIETNFQLLETPEFKGEPEALLEEAIEPYPIRLPISNLASVVLTAFGSILLAFVGWLTWYDMTVWGKDVALVFFGSRTGEAVSLGIGMRVIHYLMISFAFLLSGLFTFTRRRQETPEFEEHPEVLLEEAIELSLVGRPSSNLASVVLTAFGSILLAFVGWLTWYDMTVWGKDVALVFFGSRTGEAISLGIGMRVIHYLMISFAFLLSGLFTFTRRRRSAV